MGITDKLMITFTAVTAATAVAGVWVANGQLAEMQSNSKDTQKMIAATQKMADANSSYAQSAAVNAKAAEGALSVGQRSVETANRQLDLQADAARREARAYLAFETGVVQRFDVGKPVRVQVAWTNSGRDTTTPTAWRAAVLVADPSKTGMIAFEPCRELMLSQSAYHGMAGGRFTHWKETAAALTEGERQAVEAGRLSVIYMTRICYRDAGGEHNHDGCYIWRAEGGVFRPVALCERGNGAA